MRSELRTNFLMISVREGEAGVIIKEITAKLMGFAAQGQIFTNRLRRPQTIFWKGHAAYVKEPVPHIKTQSGICP